MLQITDSEYYIGKVRGILQQLKISCKMCYEYKGFNLLYYRRSLVVLISFKSDRISSDIFILVGWPLYVYVFVICFTEVICMTAFYKYLCTARTFQSGGRLNKKDGLTRYGDSHVKDKTS